MKSIGMIVLTSWPVQKIGHFVHGASLAFPSQVLRYGLLTTSGRTGGLNVDASTTAESTPAMAAAAAVWPKRILRC